MMNPSFTMLRSILSVAACISLVQEAAHKALTPNQGEDDNDDAPDHDKPRDKKKDN